MKTTIKKMVLGLMALIGLSACSPYVLTTSSVLNSADLTEYKSFSFAPIQKEKLPPSFDVSEAQALRSLIAAELESRGYKEVKRGGDMEVCLTLSSEKSVERSLTTSGYRTGGGVVRTGRRGRTVVGVGGTSSRTTTASAEVVTEGYITMDLMQSRGNKYLFTAEVCAEGDLQYLILKDNEELEKAIDKLFKKFPVKSEK